MEINQPLNGGFKKVEFNFTGFMPFEGVSENPTELLMKEFLRRKAEGEGSNLGEIRIVNVAVGPAEKAVQEFYLIMNEKQKGSADVKQILLHFGVDTEINEYCLELHGYNEADFFSPDNHNNTLKNQKIDTQLPREHYYRTILPVEMACRRLSNRFPVKISTDPGRFLCNYIYYRSLKKSYETGIPCIFTHVPHHSTIPIEEQLKFIEAILSFLSDYYLNTLAKQFNEDEKKKITYILENVFQATELDVCEFLDRNKLLNDKDELLELYKEKCC